MISAVPRALKRFMRAMRLRAWYPVQRFQNALPSYRVARRMSLRARAAYQSSLHARPFFRIGMIGVGPRARMAVWQQRAS
jgi:hypothetical protein